MTVRCPLALLLLVTTTAVAQDERPSDDARFEALERRIRELEARDGEQRPEQPEPAAEPQPERSNADADADADDGLLQGLLERAWLDRFTLGGYGELHANFTEGKGGDQFDIHRLVVFLGYQFNDWIRFVGEVELEHAYVSQNSGGELLLEQAFVDFSLSNAITIRAGRFLTPVGLTNRKHEPPVFNGVERPSFSRYVIPSTWSSDGVGIYGRPLPWLRYEAYVGSSLDGSQFEDLDGIRGGRMKERPGLHEPAVMGRIDLFPFAVIDPGLGQVLRVGVSGFYGGLDNGNKGSNPDVEGELSILSMDVEYSIWNLDLKGAIAWERIDQAGQIGNGAPSEVLGFFVEAALHVWPDAWRTGLLHHADLVVFARYDDYDTQYRVPKGNTKNRAGNRHDYTFGLGFYILPNLVLKADYQLRKDGVRGNDLPDLINVGLGWQF